MLPKSRGKKRTLFPVGQRPGIGSVSCDRHGNSPDRLASGSLIVYNVRDGEGVKTRMRRNFCTISLPLYETMSILWGMERATDLGWP